MTWAPLRRFLDETTLSPHEQTARSYRSAAQQITSGAANRVPRAGASASDHTSQRAGALSGGTERRSGCSLKPARLCSGQPEKRTGAHLCTMKPATEEYRPQQGMSSLSSPYEATRPILVTVGREFGVNYHTRAPRRSTRLFIPLIHKFAKKRALEALVNVSLAGYTAFEQQGSHRAGVPRC